MSLRPRFIGTALTLPKRGDRIRVLSGECENQEFEVVRIEGSAFQPESSQVVVELDGEECWLHPWDISTS